MSAIGILLMTMKSLVSIDANTTKYIFYVTHITLNSKA